jgi:hypothetical protein
MEEGITWKTGDRSFQHVFILKRSFQRFTVIWWVSMYCNEPAPSCEAVDLELRNAVGLTVRRMYLHLVNKFVGVFTSRLRRSAKCEYTVGMAFYPRCTSSIAKTHAALGNVDFS